MSALDVPVRAQVLNLRVDLQQAMGVACVFSSHDLGVVRHAADEAMVRHLGKVVQHGPCESIFGYPQHPHPGTALGHAHGEPGAAPPAHPAAG